MIEKIIEIQNELSALENWFKKYDIQAIQYQRDIRTKGNSNIDIITLDNEAYDKAKKIKELRVSLIEQYKISK